MRSRIALFLMLAGLATVAHAEMVQAPQLLVYAPNMLGQYVGDQGRLPFQGALPAGSGLAVAAFAQLIGLIAVCMSLSNAWDMSSTSGSMRHQSSWAGCICMFVAGVCVFHVDKTMAMFAATIPGFPDLTPILQY